MWYMSETGVTETITRFTYVTYVYETCHIRIYTNTLILQICTQTTNIYFIRLYCQLRHSVLVNNARARTRMFLCVIPSQYEKSRIYVCSTKFQKLSSYIFADWKRSRKMLLHLLATWTRMCLLILLKNNYYCSFRQWIINGYFNRTTISPYDSTHLSIPIHSQCISRNDFIINNIRRWIFPMPDLSKWAVTFAAQRSWQQVTKFQETFISLH